MAAHQWFVDRARSHPHHEAIAFGQERVTYGELARRAFLLALCREPSLAELSTLRAYYQRQLTDLSDEPDRAKSLLSPELAATDPVGRGSPDPAPTAALVLACRAIFNTDSFITRE